MAKIISLSIDWMEGWGNDPRIEIEVDGDIPQWPDKYARVWKKFDSIHRAISGIFVHYFHSDGNPTTAYAGREFSGTFEDGGTFKYKGAWSSRAACVNKYTDCKVVDVAVRSKYLAIAVFAQSIIDFWRAHPELPFGLAWVDTGDMAPTIQPLRADGTTKRGHRIVQQFFR